MTTKQTYEVLVCAFNSKGEVLTVNQQDVLQLPRGEPTKNETQRQASVRILKEQTGFNVQENDMVALVYDKLKENHFVLSYLCTKVLEEDMTSCTFFKCKDGINTYKVNYHNDWFGFIGTQKFLDNCVYAEYHHTALYHANILNKQLQLPNVFSQTQIVKHREAHKDIKKITVESKLNKQKGTEMQTEITKDQTNKALELVNGGEYVTRTGETVKMSIDEYCRPGQGFHQFLGSNGFYYKTNGKLFSHQDHEADVVRDVQPACELEMQTQQEPEVKTYTYNEVCGAIADAYHKGVSDGKAEIVSAGADKSYSTQEMRKLTDDSFFKGVDQGVSRATTFSTFEIQSLIAQQSKVITALESEILDLKETAGYLGGNPNSRLQELRKKIYNEITSKQKRLGKLVVLQTKLKRAK